VDILRDALARDREIRVASVFGSLVKGLEKAESDIDLIVIGNLGLRSLSHLLNGIAEKVGREINPFILTPEEFSTWKLTNEHFLSRVLKEPRLFILGNENDLKTMG